MDTRHRSVRIPAELDRVIEEKAAKLDRSASWVILRCLEMECGGAREKLEAKRLLNGGLR